MEVKKLLRSTLMIALTIGAMHVQATSVTIDFEGLANLEIVTNQFSADNVIFDNAIVLESFSTLNEIDFPPTSGIHAISGLAAGPIVIEFATIVDSFSAEITTANSAIVEVLDVTSSLLTSIAVAPNLGSPTLVSFTGVVARVEFSSVSMGDAFFLTLDDVGFERTVAAPEPTTAILLVFSFAGLWFASRQRRR